MSRRDAKQIGRHCSNCGTDIPLQADKCPRCSAVWKAPNLEAGELGRTIDVLSAARTSNAIPQFPYEVTRQSLETILRQRIADRDERELAADAVPAREASAPIQSRSETDTASAASHARGSQAETATAAVTFQETPQRSAPIRKAAPSKPSGPPLGEVLVAWAARRQADILLYLGAFLLTAAALSFVAYRGDTASGLLRFVIVSVYTVTFLSLGFSLRKRERVREAGPVFLAVGAILVPIDFFALRAAITGAQLPADVATLIGSATCSAFYFTLAARGFGKYYVVPAVPSAMLAWGALATVLELPASWFGAWYELPAAGAWVAASAISWKPAPLVRRGAVSTSFVALNYSFGASVLDGTNEWVLPVTLLIITCGLAGGFFFRRSVLGLAVLPLSASGAAIASLHAAVQIDWTWYALSVALAGAGYLFIGAIEQPKHRRVWQSAAMAMWLLALGTAHAGVWVDGAEAFALPATYGLVLGGLASGVAGWRLSWRPGVAAVPAVVAGTVAALLWAGLGLPLEWLPAFGMATAFGYLYTADIDREFRGGWQWVALLGSAPAAVSSILVASLPEDVARTTHWQLPLTLGLGLLAAGVGIARWRLSWRPGVAAAPAVAAATAASLFWAWLDMPLEWIPTFAMVAMFGYLYAADVDALLGDRWRWMTLLGGACAATSSMVVAFLPEDVVVTTAWQLPATLSVGLAAVAAGVGRWRLSWRPGLATLSPLAVAAPAALLWVWVDMPLEWLSAFTGAATLGFVVISVWDRSSRANWRLAALVTGGLSISAAQLFAFRVDPGDRVQLPVAYLVVLAAALVDGTRYRDRGLMFVPALVAASGMAWLWAFDLDASWWALPPTLIGVAIAAGSRLWVRHADLEQWGWPYALVLAATPLAFVGPMYDQNVAGLAANAAGAAGFAIGAFRSRGALGRLAATLPGRGPVLLQESECFVLAATAAAFLFAATGHVNALIGASDADRSWAFALIASLSWSAVIAYGKRRLPLAVFAPIGAAGFGVAGVLASETGSTVTMVLALATVLPAVAFATTRSWSLWVVSFVFAALAARAVWFWQGFDTATLPVAYAAMSGGCWALLLTVRRYGPLRTERDAAVQALSWGPWALAAASAAFVLAERAETLTLGDTLASTREWAMASVVLAAASAAVLGEALVLKRRWIVIAGTVGLLLAVLMLIATSGPSNVQAYTGPLGLYVLVLGLTFRRSEPLFGPHMAMHEALIVGGALALVLPAAAQSFSPGGGRFGFEVIGLGLAFLATGLVIHSRWLIPTGVLCLTGVALRWLTGGYVTVPYWMILGVLGTLLLAFGTVVLFERDAWDVTKERFSRWWLGGFGNPA